MRHGLWSGFHDDEESAGMTAIIGAGLAGEVESEEAMVSMSMQATMC
jgi:hypothetical protein